MTCQPGEKDFGKQPFKKGTTPRHCGLICTRLVNESALPYFDNKVVKRNTMLLFSSTKWYRRSNLATYRYLFSIHFSVWIVITFVIWNFKEVLNILVCRTKLITSGSVSQYIWGFIWTSLSQSIVLSSVNQRYQIW